jgi:hypothetical protein
MLFVASECENASVRALPWDCPPIHPSAGGPSSVRCSKAAKKAPARFTSGDADLAALAASISAVAESVSPEAAAAAAAIPLPRGPAKPERGGEADPDKDPDLRATFDAVAVVNEKVQSERASNRPVDLLRTALAKMEAYLSLQSSGALKEPEALRGLVTAIEAAIARIKRSLSKRA